MFASGPKYEECSSMDPVGSAATLWLVRSEFFFSRGSSYPSQALLMLWSAGQGPEHQPPSVSIPILETLNPNETW